MAEPLASLPCCLRRRRAGLTTTSLLGLPSHHAGINIKADVSMWLACFLGSIAVLGLLHGLYGLLVALRVLDPRLYRWTPAACS